MTQAGDKKAPDWERIELDYRTGILSLREIAEPYAVTEGAIRKRAKRDDWTRDLSSKIKAKADNLVRKEAVRSEVRSETAITERVLVDENAILSASVQISHRTAISRSTAIVSSLFTELETPADDEPLTKRVDCAKKLIDAQKVLIGLEREAYNIGNDVVKSASQTLSDLMDELTGEG